MSGLRRVVASVRSGQAVQRAKDAVEQLRNDYEAGKRGEDIEPQPLWMGPRQQLDTMVAMLRRASAATPADGSRLSLETGGKVAASDGSDPAGGMDREEVTFDDVDIDALADEVEGVDWARVRAATAEKSAEAAAVMQRLATNVDWSRAQPMVRQLSSALIAAVASGRLMPGGPLGAMVARTIVNDANLGAAVAERLRQRGTTPPADFRSYIDTSASEA
jgi:hypothetical protein